MTNISSFAREWLLTNTFAPRWLPQRLRHPASAFGLAVIIQAVAIALTALLLYFEPGFSFRGSFILLGVILTALTIGGGPGLIASFVGTAMLDFFLVPPFFSFSFKKEADVVSVVFYLIVCVATNMAATHADQRHRNFLTYVQHAEPHTSPASRKTEQTLSDIEQRLRAAEMQQALLAQAVAKHSVTLAKTITDSQANLADQITALLQVNASQPTDQ